MTTQKRLENGFTYRDSVLRAAVSEAINWTRSWADLWYYDMDAKQRGVFLSFADFSQAADRLYKETI